MENRTYRVLLIEDNPGDAFLIKFYLEESGTEYDLIHADQLAIGLRYLESEKFDIVLLDLNLPDSFGKDTVNKLIEAYPNQLIIVLTGLTDGKLGVETVQLGAQDFLIKGRFDERVLTSSIRYAIERFKMNNKLDEYNHELDDSYHRFDDIQHLLDLGYFELNPGNFQMYWSHHLYQMLNIKRKEQDRPILDDFAELIAEREVRDELLNIGSGQKKTMKVTLSDKRKAELTFTSNDTSAMTTKGTLKIIE